MEGDDLGEKKAVYILIPSQVRFFFFSLYPHFSLLLIWPNLFSKPFIHSEILLILLSLNPLLSISARDRTQGLSQAKGSLYQEPPLYTPSQGALINYERDGGHLGDGYFGIYEAPETRTLFLLRRSWEGGVLILSGTPFKGIKPFCSHCFGVGYLSPPLLLCHKGTLVGPVIW